MRISTILGTLLVLTSGWMFATGSIIGGAIMLIIGVCLVLLGVYPGRRSQILFGHACIVVGCLLVTWGIYLAPVSRPTLLGILTRPLFWGLFSIFGGICATFHGFCNCVRSCAAQRREGKVQE